MEKKEKRKLVWVVFSEGSGAVRAIYFRQPTITETGSRVIKTVLGERDCQRAHQLRVVGERVFHVPSMGGL